MSKRLSLKESAIHSGRSVATIRRRIADGTLPAYWEGNQQFIDPADLDSVFAPRRVIAKSGVTDLDTLVKQTVSAWPRLTPAQRELIISLGGAA